ncbi:MAG: hypothetical protein CL946_06290 [Ectothiorhodospiraceae bacterium]|nr:hypothetical protein [Ectothiorhodospiraceae bacterium]
MNTKGRPPMPDIRIESVSDRFRIRWAGKIVGYRNSFDQADAYVERRITEHIAKEVYDDLDLRIGSSLMTKNDSDKLTALIAPVDLYLNNTNL